MPHAQTTLEMATTGPGLYEFTDSAQAFVTDAGPTDLGLLTVFVRHTSCALLIQENADPDVQTDLQTFFRRLVPAADDPSMNWIRHRAEGTDDMPAHIRSALTATTLSIPVARSRLTLGTWQGLYLYEHRTRPHQRQLILHLSR
ncbi:secondary thiamine-phosphate synthase enzyme YjbQ [Pseudohoeflea coraliihabitans]|uniref:Secondary thiamine-phosphate synthase enzyme YjbQ n=1 Tax=Pseudohoeflea coraliihabitans TaxID=2860393 RepID=A0ABS6WN60_9HYPH|nr:secondary thiamine-phosphate synthase enzyme YjbQ [Pseudohoeflea sp. DP4N28-3]MBW3097399.1 secondary thiamine-phosphate synthase enzyme YjbQ [Pseudohoeflea sp. DP4N28-3]